MIPIENVNPEIISNAPSMIYNIVNTGILVVIAYIYLTSNKKREEDSQTLVKDIINQLFGYKAGSAVGNKENGITLDKFITERIDKYEEKNIQEHNELKEILKRHEQYFEKIQNDITDLFVVLNRQESDEKKIKKYKAELREKIADCLPYFSNEKLRIYIVDQSTKFSKWVIDSVNCIFDSQPSMELAFEELRNICESLHTRCTSLLDEELCISYYEIRKVRMDKYFDDVRKLCKHTANDKIDRFIRKSIDLMQDSISELLELWIDSKDIKKTFKKIESMNPVLELKRLETKIDNSVNK